MISVTLLIPRVFYLSFSLSCVPGLLATLSLPTDANGGIAVNSDGCLNFDLFAVVVSLWEETTV